MDNSVCNVDFYSCNIIDFLTELGYIFSEYEKDKICVETDKHISSFYTDNYHEFRLPRDIQYFINEKRYFDIYNKYITGLFRWCGIQIKISGQ